ncbi:hypothetical protein BRD08_00710 [Halobacteriales archaeon SW_10_66_29]|nr:MAG: hypothetical protein BRD08_00710 [Halobacteriales archaeon SW_10_66_29]
MAGTCIVVDDKLDVSWVSIRKFNCANLTLARTERFNFFEELFISEFFRIITELNCDCPVGITFAGRLPKFSKKIQNVFWRHRCTRTGALFLSRGFRFRCHNLVFSCLNTKFTTFDCVIYIIDSLYFSLHLRDDILADVFRDRDRARTMLNRWYHTIREEHSNLFYLICICGSIVERALCTVKSTLMEISFRSFHLFVNIDCSRKRRFPLSKSLFEEHLFETSPNRRFNSGECIPGVVQ